MFNNFKPNIPTNIIPRIDTGEERTRKMINDIQKDVADEKAEEKADRKKLIELADKNNELLREIKSSLKGLDDIIHLLMQSKDHQEEILELLNEVLLIGTSPDEVTALSRYEEVEGKINKAAEVIESIKTFGGLAKYILYTTIGPPS